MEECDVAVKTSLLGNKCCARCCQHVPLSLQDPIWVDLAVPSAVDPTAWTPIPTNYCYPQTSVVIHHQHLLQKIPIMLYFARTAIICCGEANVFAHRHQEEIFVDEEEVNTHRDALLCGYKLTWHRHNVWRFPCCCFFAYYFPSFWQLKGPKSSTWFGSCLTWNYNPWSRSCARLYQSQVATDIATFHIFCVLL